MYKNTSVTRKTHTTTSAYLEVFVTPIKKTATKSLQKVQTQDRETVIWVIAAERKVSFHTEATGTAPHAHIPVPMQSVNHNW